MRWTIAACATAWMCTLHAAPFAERTHATVDYASPRHQPDMRCKDLVATSSFDFTVIRARSIPSSAQAPAHCRIEGIVPLEISFEVNLPSAWNGRLYMYGNGGLAGTPATDPARQESRDRALRNAFVTAYTDTGHDRRVEPGGTFAHKNTHKLVDYGFRAVHLTVEAAKRLSAAFYGQRPQFSYWDGCSTGGRQGMLSAQRFPEDFNGILAGAPAADYSGLKFSQAWRVAAISDGGFTEAEALVLARHVYQACDAKDGARDGLIGDPRRCDFRPERDLPRCTGRDRTECFDDDELSALQRYYAPVVLAGREIYPAMPVGSEALGTTYDGSERTGWYPWLINNDGPVLLDLLGSDFFRFMVFIEDRADFDWTEFDFQDEPDNLDTFRAIVDATDPDLSAFKAANGKLLTYFGWADPDINPLSLLAYRDEVRALDPEADDYFAVFMLPGMFHCRGGPGPDRFDAMSTLIDWVEAGVTPAELTTWREPEPGKRTDVRPACPYPAQARPTDAGWVCGRPPN